MKILQGGGKKIKEENTQEEEIEKTRKTNGKEEMQEENRGK